MVSGQSLRHIEKRLHEIFGLAAADQPGLRVTFQELRDHAGVVLFSVLRHHVVDLFHTVQLDNIAEGLSPST
jgi:hypothetical protein